MGDVRLGALLGAENRSLSFDVASAALGALAVGSWSRVSAQSSLALVTEAHSSGQGFQVRANSDAAESFALRYAFGFPGDAHARWAPDLTQHTLRALAWARAEDAQSGDQLRLVLQGSGGSATALIAQAAALARYELNLTGITSAGDFPRFGVERVTQPGSVALVRLDDVLVAADEQTLLPGWDLARREELIVSRHSSLAGRDAVTSWGGFQGFTLRLEWIAGSRADLLHHWWRGQVPCLFTLDTSDATACWPVRIVNRQRPLGQRVRPHVDHYRGALELQSIYGNELVF